MQQCQQQDIAIQSLTSTFPQGHKQRQLLCGPFSHTLPASHLGNKCPAVSALRGKFLPSTMHLSWLLSSMPYACLMFSKNSACFARFSLSLVGASVMVLGLEGGLKQPLHYRAAAQNFTETSVALNAT